MIYLFSKLGNPEKQLVTCSERLKQIYPKNVKDLRETLFDTLDQFMMSYKEEQQLIILNHFV